MVISVRNLQNAAALAKFDALQEKGSSPSLAISHWGEIVVIENETGVIGAIKYLWTKFLFCIGILSSDQLRLESYKQSASLCCSSLAEHHLEGRVRGLKDEVSDKEKTISDLRSSIFDAQQIKGDLEKKAHNLEESARSTKEEFDRHTCHLRQCQESKDKINALEIRKTTLQTELEEVSEKHKAVPGMREEIERLSQQVSELQRELKALIKSVEQADYKARYEQLIQEKNQLVATSLHDKLAIDNLTRQLRAAEQANATLDEKNLFLRSVEAHSRQEIQSLRVEKGSLRAQLALEVTSHRSETPYAAPPIPVCRINPGANTSVGGETRRVSLGSHQPEVPHVAPSPAPAPAGTRFNSGSNTSPGGETKRVSLGSHQPEVPHVAPTPAPAPTSEGKRIVLGSHSTEASVKPSGTDRIPIKRK